MPSLLSAEMQFKNQTSANLSGSEGVSKWDFLKLDSFKNLPEVMLQQYDGSDHIAYQRR